MRLCIQSNLREADAITRAQRIFIASPRFSPAYFWATYVLIGDWN
jgi:CHAT domain-containing protein